MFYAVVFILLEFVTCVHIVTENGTIYFDNSTDSVLLICKFTDPGNVSTVTYQNLNTAGSDFASSIAVFTGCDDVQNKPQAIITCNYHNNEFSADILIENIKDGEQWRCGGTGAETGFSQPITVLSVVPVNNVVLNHELQSISVDEGHNVSLECQSNPACRPKAELGWFKSNGGEISDGLDDPSYTKDQVDGTLTVGNLRLTYTGKPSDNRNSLYCTATQLSKSVKSSLILLNVRYPPPSQLMLSLFPNGTIAENTPVNATCFIHGGNPLATLELLCDGKSGSNYSTPLSSISILIFKATSSYNGKKCVCSATHQVNSFKVNKSSEIIDVQYAPSRNPIITQTPTNPLISNTFVILTCSISGGNPLATLSWDCGENVTSNDSGNTVMSNLTLFVNKLYDGRVCTCTAAQSVTGYNQKVARTLLVYYSPDLPLSIRQNPFGNIDTGKTLNLTCEVTGGNPLANLSLDCGTEYTYNTFGNTSSVSVRITVNKTLNNKSCTCSATHPVPSFRPTIQHVLIVNYPPSIPALIMKAKSPLFEGNETEIRCSVSDTGNPHANFTWMWNMTVQHPSKSNTFRIGPLSRSDNGALITCLVHNEYSDRTGIDRQANTSLDVEYNPIVVLESLTVMIVEGQTLFIQCVVFGNPIPKANWVKEGYADVLSEGSDSINMTKIQVDRNDKGFYQCTAISTSDVYGTLTNSKSVELIVYYPPDVHILNQETANSVVYVCNATGNPKNYTYMGWEQTYNDIVIRTSNQLETRDNNKILTLNTPSFSDSGNYTCFVTNGVSDRNGSIQQFSKKQLNVRVSPQLIPGLPRDATYSTVKGGTITIGLKYFSFPNITNAFWYNVTSNSSIEKNNDVFFSFEKKTIETTLHGVKVNVSDFAYKAILKLDNFVAQMEGFYILRLQNGYKDKDITVKAVISSKPEDPSNINVTSKTSTTITLHWNRGFDGGHLQSFNISIFDSSGVRVTNLINDDYNDTQMYVISALSPSTEYVIHLFAYNKINSSNVMKINTTTNAEVSKSSEQQFPVGGIAGGVVGVLIAAVVLMVIFIKRRWSTSPKGNANKKSDRNTLTSSGEDNDGDGLKINDLYVSAGDDFIQSSKPGDVYAVVDKSNGGKHDDNPDMKETALYAEVNKSKGKSKANTKGQMSLATNKKGKNKIEKARNDDVYENMNEGIKRPISPPNKNKDGLVYADLVFNDNGRKKFVIRGLENKTNYADIDLNIKVDPLPSDESDTEDEHLANKSNEVQESQ